MQWFVALPVEIVFVNGQCSDALSIREKSDAFSMFVRIFDGSEFIRRLCN